jgi:putative hydrolase of the HAD superfamily
VLQAENIGASKPDVRAFEAVREATGCPLSDVVHVGDSLETDVLGALRAGATAVWLNRNGSLEDNGVLAHRQVRTLTELPALIDTL